MKVELSGEARGQVQRIDAWWRENRRVAPDLFTDELDQALRALEDAPGLGVRYEPEGKRSSPALEADALPPLLRRGAGARVRARRLERLPWPRTAPVAGAHLEGHQREVGGRHRHGACGRPTGFCQGEGRGFKSLFPLHFEGEAILTADLDLAEVVRAKFDFDVTGHYARPDVFRLLVNETPTPAVSFRRLST